MSGKTEIRRLVQNMALVPIVQESWALIVKNS